MSKDTESGQGTRGREIPYGEHGIPGVRVFVLRATSPNHKLRGKAARLAAADDRRIAEFKRQLKGEDGA